MSEKTDYNLLRKNLLQHGDRLERIENMTGFGTPDVNFCIDGVDGWIEMKSRVEPSRTTSKLLKSGCGHTLTLSQRNWFLKQKNAGGKGYILICTDKRWMLIDGCKYADQINDMNVRELMDILIWFSFKPLIEIDWEMLRNRLRGE